MRLIIDLVTDTMAKELKVERERSNLDLNELTHVWDGGEFITEKRREMG